MARILTYRIWCETDQKFEFVQQPGKDPAPTVCPINPAHTIDDVTITGVKILPGKDLTSFYNSIVIRGSGKDYVEASNVSWKSWAKFVFPGTNNIMIPTTAYFIGWVDLATDKARFRIKDVTNSKTIARTSLISSQTEIISIDSTLVDLPEDPAIFELQAKLDSAGGGYLLGGCGFGTT